MELIGLNEQTSESREGGEASVVNGLFWTLSSAVDGLGKPVLLKKSKGAMPRADETQLYINDFIVSKKLSKFSRYILRALELDVEHSPITMSLEGGSYVSLDDLLGQPLSLERFLNLAIEMTRAVQDVHDAGFTHSLLSPASFLVEPPMISGTLEAKSVKLINFGWATGTGQEPPRFSPGGPDYAFISPEQTGRMNRRVDYRTDFYSLGVVFHRMLAGSLPIQGGDALSWFHAHMTTVPPRLSDLRFGIPPIISEIIGKLLRKMPDERYQSAIGVIKDLERCRQELALTGTISSFLPGREDRVPVFNQPKKLYGRQRELDFLLRSFELAKLGRASGVTLISGYSGIGKSSLVQELGVRVARGKGRLVSGKFEQQNRNTPYFTFTAALRELILGMVARGEDKVRVWGELLRKELGPSVSVLSVLVPEIALLAGPVLAMPVEGAMPDELEWRFLRAIHAFLEIAEDIEQPLVIFLDDLQWADAATLKLLEFLASSANLEHIFFIGAYRENEVTEGHPLVRMAERLRRSGFCHEIKLAPLVESDVRCLISDTLQEDEARVSDLAKQVYVKTAGNPFFILQFLKTVISERFLLFDGRSGHWIWDIEKIESSSSTESALDLMTKAIGRLDATTRDCLKMAATVGSQFRIETLARASGRSYIRMAADLSPAIAERLVLRKDAKTYAFQHDRIQQAALLLVGKDEEMDFHLKIARALLSEAEPENLGEHVFEILSHFNLCLNELREPDERRAIAVLNLQAGRKAKAAAASSAATGYLSLGISLLPANCWELDYQLTFDLFLEAAHAVYLEGDNKRAEDLLQALSDHVFNAIDRAKMYHLWISVHLTRGEMQKAIQAGREALADLGWELPLDPGEEETNAAYDDVWKMLEGREIESLIDLAFMTDERTLAVQKIFAGILLPAHFAGSYLNRYITAKMIMIGIRYGINADSVHAFSWFAVTLVDRSIGRYQDGYRFGRLAYDLMRKHKIISCQGKVCLFFGDIVRNYRLPLQGSRAFIQEGLEASLASGDLTAACYLSNHVISNMLASSESLDEVWLESERRLKFVRQARDPNIEKIILSQQRFIQNMQGKTLGRLDFGCAEQSEVDLERRIQKSEMTLMKFWYYVLKLSARFIYGDFRGAASIVPQARDLSFSDPFDIQSTLYFFYSAMALAADYDSVEEDRKGEYRRTILAHRDQLRVWSENCPENFEARYLMVCAEVARIDGQSLEALRFYERAISSAEDNGFHQKMAIACERAAQMHFDLGLAVTGKDLLERARGGFLRWGASGKVAQLEERLAQIGRVRETVVEGGAAEPELLPSFSRLVDLGAVIKAQRAISGELIPENLHRRFLEVVVESAGAHRGVLILFRDEHPTIELEFDGGKFQSFSLPVESSDQVPRTLIDYVERVKNRVVLGDARKPHLFSGDGYFSLRWPISVLCMPIMRQNRLLAIIYLENNLSTQSFTDKCLDLLEMLGSQAAISIENSYLYDDMRASIKARDEFMAIASHELKSPLSSVSVMVQTLKLILQKGRLAEYPEEKILGLLEGSGDSIRHLAALIDQLLDVSRFTLGTLKLRPEALDLSDQVREGLRVHQREFANARCVVKADLTDNIVGEWDRPRLQQVIGNLLSNAAKYGAGKPVQIATFVRPERAVLRISDQGIGISEQDIARLFRPFERAVPYQSISGFGLGLYIVKRVVEAHQGEIVLKSELGRGTTFEIELPLKIT